MGSNLTKIKIRDRAFKHCQYHGQPLPRVDTSKYMEWDWDVSQNEELVFYTDDYISNPQKTHTKRIAWLIEPRCKQPQTYNWIQKNNSLYDFVLTHDKELLDLGGNFIYYPHCGNWIEEENRNPNHVKTKLVSMITSGKRNVGDHLKRHELISRYSDKIDVMGRGYKPIEPISKGLKDYRFHIAMENQAKDYYFTEKIINPIMTGTIPIYYGPECVKEIFDSRGIIFFENIDQIPNILNSLDDNLYQKMLPYAIENFKLAQKYRLSEDWMVENNVFERLGIKLGFSK
tara:strand:+ start:2439 stop:3299 length:861 start_codon:yes stop_codon:yes gene_type:complete